jgi:hypothetical protein
MGTFEKVFLTRTPRVSRGNMRGTDKPIPKCVTDAIVGLVVEVKVEKLIFKPFISGVR